MPTIVEGKGELEGRVVCQICGKVLKIVNKLHFDKLSEVMV